jgi:hypothetical protein
VLNLESVNWFFIYPGSSYVFESVLQLASLSRIYLYIISCFLFVIKLFAKALGCDESTVHPVTSF